MSDERRLRIKARAGRVLLAILVVVAAVGVLWYRRFARDVIPEAPGGQVANATRAEMVIRDFRHVETRMDRTIWVLESAQAEVFEEETSLQEVKITWYGELGTIPVVITSREGRINFRNRNARLAGRVRLARADGVVLETEQLTWVEESKLLQAPRAVLITGPTYTFRGTSLVADVGRQWVRLNGLVEGEVREALSALAGSS